MDVKNACGACGVEWHDAPCAGRKQSVRIVSSGDGWHTRVYIDGEQRNDVLEVTWRVEARGPATATVTFFGAEVDVVGELETTSVLAEQGERPPRE